MNSVPVGEHEKNALSWRPELSSFIKCLSRLHKFEFFLSLKLEIALGSSFLKHDKERFFGSR